MSLIDREKAIEKLQDEIQTYNPEQGNCHPLFHEFMRRVVPKLLQNVIDWLNKLPAVEADLPQAEEKQRRSDCESCGKVDTCYHNHGRHGVVRINCPLWRPKA